MKKRLWTATTALLLTASFLLAACSEKESGDAVPNEICYEQISVLGELVDGGYDGDGTYSFRIKDKEYMFWVEYENYEEYKSAYRPQNTTQYFYLSDIVSDCYLDTVDLSKIVLPSEAALPDEAELYVLDINGAKYMYANLSNSDLLTLLHMYIPMRNGWYLRLVGYDNYDDMRPGDAGFLSNYPTEGEATFMTRLLHTDTAEEAIAELRASIENYGKATEEPVSPWVVVGAIGGGVVAVALVATVSSLVTVKVMRKKAKRKEEDAVGGDGNGSNGGSGGDGGNGGNGDESKLSDALNVPDGDVALPDALGNESYVHTPVRE